MYHRNRNRRAESAVYQTSIIFVIFCSRNCSEMKSLHVAGWVQLDSDTRRTDPESTQ